MSFDPESVVYFDDLDEEQQVEVVDNYVAEMQHYQPDARPMKSYIAHQMRHNKMDMRPYLNEYN